MAASYRKLDPDDPVWELIEDLGAFGKWCCDSYDHNEDSGCSNPGCWKRPKEISSD